MVGLKLIMEINVVINYSVHVQCGGRCLGRLDYSKVNKLVCEDDTWVIRVTSLEGNFFLGNQSIFVNEYFWRINS